MNIKVNKACSIAKNALCAHWTLCLHLCHILYALQYFYLLQAALPQNTPNAAVQHLYSNVFISYRPSHLSVSDSLVYSSCLSCLQCYKPVDSSRQTTFNTATSTQTAHTLLPLQPMPLDYHCNRSLYHTQCLLVTA